MFKVFIPTDFSKNAANAISYALKFTKKIDCKLTFFHGGILPMPIGEVPILTSNLDSAKVIEKMKTDLNRLAKDQRAKLNEKRISFIVREDFSLPPLIESKAEELKTDLIIMGTHGASGIKKALIGSNTVDVISRSNIPVLAVPQNYAFKGVKKILMPSNLVDIHKELREALPFAKLFNATLEVHFISDASEDAMKKFDAAMKLIKKNAYKKIKLSIEGVQFLQSIAKDIELAVKEKKPDLLIMFRHQHNWLGNLFLTSQTDKLAFTSKIPMLALREPK